MTNEFNLQSRKKNKTKKKYTLLPFSMGQMQKDYDNIRVIYGNIVYGVIERLINNNICIINCREDPLSFQVSPDQSRFRPYLCPKTVPKFLGWDGLEEVVFIKLGWPPKLDHQSGTGLDLTRIHNHNRMTHVSLYSYTRKKKWVETNQHLWFFLEQLGFNFVNKTLMLTVTEHGIPLNSVHNTTVRV